MADTANDILQAELTLRDIQIERYKRGLVMRILKLLAELEEDVIKRIAALDPTEVLPRYKQARLARLLASIQERVDIYSQALNEEVLPELSDLARDEGKFGVRMIKDVLPVALDTVAPSAAMLRAAVTARPFQGRLLKEWVTEQPVAVKMRLARTIRMGVAEGQTIDQMVRAVRGTAAQQYRDGIMEINRRGAEAMVRTAVNHTVAASRETLYDANSDLIKGVRWVSTLDSRTSQTCISLDGKVFEMNKGPRPPAHVNCRSSTVPVLKSWKELGITLSEAPAGTRASMDGQVSAKVTYGTWLKSRPAEFQDEVLGKTRAELFRKGDLEVDQFTDASGHVYTLDELRKREPEAFKRAGLE